MALTPTALFAASSLPSPPQPSLFPPFTAALLDQFRLQYQHHFQQQQQQQSVAAAATAALFAASAAAAVNGSNSTNIWVRLSNVKIGTYKLILTILSYYPCYTIINKLLQ
jgi:hypothetical protein